MKPSITVSAPMALLTGLAALTLVTFDLGYEHVPAKVLVGRTGSLVVLTQASMPATTSGAQPAPARPLPTSEGADPSTELALSTDISLIHKALAAQDTKASPYLVYRALENALMSRRTDIPTAFSTAEMLTASADNVGYLEWVVHALAGNLTQRDDETDPVSASEAAYATIIDKLLSQQRFDLAMQLSDQSLRALPQNEELLAARARVLSASGDHVGAVSALGTIENPSDLVLAQLVQYLHRADQPVAAGVLADRIRRSAPELAGVIDHVPPP